MRETMPNFYKKGPGFASPTNDPKFEDSTPKPQGSFFYSSKKNHSRNNLRAKLGASNRNFNRTVINFKPNNWNKRAFKERRFGDLKNFTSKRRKNSAEKQQTMVLIKNKGFDNPLQAFTTLRENKKAFKLISIMSGWKPERGQTFSTPTARSDTADNSKQSLSMPRIRLNKIILNKDSKKEPNKKSHRKTQQNQVNNVWAQAEILQRRILVEEGRVLGKCEAHIDDLSTPLTRSRSSMVSYSNLVYLFGGISHKVCNDLRVFDFESSSWKPESETHEEEKINRKYHEDSSDMLIINYKGFTPEARFGHSLIRYKDTLLLYGGENKYDKIRKRRDLYHGIILYDLNTGLWAEASCKDSIIEGRKHHAAGVFGNNMIIHGGYNSGNNIVDELVCYNIEESCFVAFDIIKNSLGKLAGHSFTSDRQQMFCFGGIDQDGETNNCIRSFEISRSGEYPRTARWDIVETAGKQPAARYMHSMGYMEESESLVLFGGLQARTPDFYGRNLTKDFGGYYLRDLWLFHVPMCQWCEVRLEGDTLEGRYSHCSAVYRNKIVIFGGLSQSGLSKRVTHLIELENTHY
ncbi:unnamed protein product [Moneuplotes crassus]|uniref:Uncharacterized protein n=1 Tax=Euplotes crassus TaxID=5936 RepID=A0AAD1X577_EUPCR|nr:unnamed protein product [Moneuplotes crassus]